MKIGATTIPLAGWIADPRRPEESRTRRLAVIRHLVEGYGLSAVELSMDLGLVFPQVFNGEFYAAVAGLQLELGFTCTVHLPFLWLDLSSMNEAVRRASVDSVRQAAELVQLVEVTTYTLHLWGFVTTQINTVLKDPRHQQALLGGVLAQAGRSLEELCQLFLPRDLCVENLESPPFDVFSPLLQRYGLSICLDVGHLAWQQGGALGFLARYGERVREVHLHDAIPAVEQERRPAQDHLPLGAGELDYRAFLRALEKTGYEGAVILELNNKAHLEHSLERVKAYL